MPYQTELKKCEHCGIEKNISIKRRYCGIVCSNKARTGIKRPEHSKIMSGSNNPSWKERSEGNMEALHQWMRKRYPKKELCEICGEVEPIDLANRSGEYKQLQADWYWLCRKCHMLSDGRMVKNLKPIKKGQHLSPNTEFKKRMLIN